MFYRTPKCPCRTYIILNNLTKIQSFRSALCDWFIILCLLSVTGFLESPTSIPYHQCIPGWTTVPSTDNTDPTYLCGDQYSPELQYPYKPSTIDTELLAILAFGPWILTLIINTILLYCLQPIYRPRVIGKHIEVVIRMLMFSAWSTEALVSVIKFSVGRPRPNFYALMDVSRTQYEHKEARMSFPSGHSALSFAILFLLTLNLFSAMKHVQSNRFGQHNKNTLRVSVDSTHSYFYPHIWWKLRYYRVLSVLLVFTPTCLAVYIACTRITDYWHHYGDVLGGSMIGIAGASVSFMMYRDVLYPLNGKAYQQQLFEPYGEHDSVGGVGKEYDVEHNKTSLEVHDSINDAYAKMDHSAILETEPTDRNTKNI